MGVYFEVMLGLIVLKKEVIYEIILFSGNYKRYKIVIFFLFIDGI